VDRIWSAPSIPAAVLAGVEQFSERPAIVDGARTLTFADVREEMLSVAASLIASGVKRGDRVAVWAPNSAVWISAALGVLASGAWLVPINTRFKAAEAAYVLETVDASYLFVADGFLGGHQLDELRLQSPDLRALKDPILVPAADEVDGAGWRAFLARGDTTARERARGRIAETGPDDVSDVIFTSGTTGMPKGVMLRHGASLRAFHAYGSVLGLREGDRSLIALPFFHCFGYKAGWMLDLLSGATTYPLAVYDGVRAMEAIDRHRITYLPGSPTMFWPMLDDPRRTEFDLSSLRCSVVGAAFVPVELVRRLQVEVGIDMVLTAYGLTENHAMVSICRPGDSPETISTTVGQVIDGVEVKVVDDDGRELPPRSEGELLVRGFAHMSGYFGDPAATAASFTDGWLRTGDIGSLDESNYVRITDRKKDIYITGGFNVAPAEVENVLAACDRVGQVAVVGVPDDRLGEVGAAFVTPVNERTDTERQVLEFARTRLANFKVPRYVWIVDALPVNATGKVLKDELRTRHRSLRQAKD